MHVTFRPIDTWPGELRAAHARTASPFTAGYQDTLQLLDRELRHLNAKNIVIQLALPEEQIRLEGMPRADARPSHPGVILAFDSKHGPLKYSTDVYEGRSWTKQVGWQANLRAIALGLESLRKVDRYGITRRGEQYTGWKALGAGIAMPAASMSVEEAALVIVELAGHGYHGGDIPDAVEGVLSMLDGGSDFVFRDAYRWAAKRAHPDAGGTDAGFQRLQAAHSVLEAAHA